MFRRRPPRRLPRRRRPLGAGPLENQVVVALRRAHRLMESGQYEQAFPVFKRLADTAAQRGMLPQAAPLYFQAARARLEMGGAQDALALARRGIQLLVQANQTQRVRAVLPRLVRSLEDKGFHDAAVTLRAEVAALLGGAPEDMSPSSAQRKTLPTKCPSCNGPVRVDEVEWIDDQSAACAYCGSVIQPD